MVHVLLSTPQLRLASHAPRRAAGGGVGGGGPAAEGGGGWQQRALQLRANTRTPLDSALLRHSWHVPPPPPQVRSSLGPLPAGVPPVLSPVLTCGRGRALRKCGARRAAPRKPSSPPACYRARRDGGRPRLALAPRLGLARSAQRVRFRSARAPGGVGRAPWSSGSPPTETRVAPQTRRGPRRALTPATPCWARRAAVQHSLRAWVEAAAGRSHLREHGSADCCHQVR